MRQLTVQRRVAILLAKSLLEYRRSAKEVCSKNPLHSAGSLLVRAKQQMLSASEDVLTASAPWLISVQFDRPMMGSSSCTIVLEEKRRPV